jgi:hypothetical protein
MEEKVEQNNEVKEESIPSETVITPTETSIIETESVDDDFKSGEGLLTDSKYDIPDIADKFVDTKDGTVIDKTNLTPFQMIKAIAKQNNITIQEPSKGCKKCYGRGHEGLDKETKMPIPCRCLFRGQSKIEKEAGIMYDMRNNPGKPTRFQKRKMTKALYKQFKIQRRIINQQKMNPKLEKVEFTEDQKKAYVENILKTYNETKSLKKAANCLNITLTELKKVVKESRTKTESSIKE